jgi:NAD-dependent deacetylase
MLAEASDLFLVIGSSLVVHPAATLPLVAKEGGAALAILNRDPTPLDSHADFVLQAPIGEVFSALYPQAASFQVRQSSTVADM